MSLQVLILLLAKTETPTTGGLEKIFEVKKNGWINPDTLFILLLSWSLFSCIKTHTDVISTEKGFCPMTSKIIIFAWGTFATLRRILSIVATFAPSMGLFSMLHHWTYEKVPFKARLEYAKRNTITLMDKIALYGLNETIYWSEYDRWDYSDSSNPTPPSYSVYTLLSLQNTFIAFMTILVLQFIAIFIGKIWTSRDFRTDKSKTNKIIHVLENLNLATPFKDWDDGNFTLEEFRQRFKNICKEMIATFTINIIFTMIMMIPSIYCGKFHSIRTKN